MTKTSPDPDSDSVGCKLRDQERLVTKAAIVWEDVGLFPDCAVAGLGDSALEFDERWVERGGHPFPQLFNQGSGLGMLYGRAEADGIYSEVGSLDGAVVAARIEFVNDVTEVEQAGEGHWERLGFARIGPEGAVAVDKPRQRSSDHEKFWRHVIPLPAGSYEADVFMTDGDHLGLRLTTTDLPVRLGR